MQSDATRMRRRVLRMHAGNHAVCLICYAAAFAIPLLWEYIAIRMLYPWKLASTAPDVHAHLLNAFPALDRWLSPVAVPAAGNAFSLREMLAVREENWLTALVICALAAWGLTLLVQLIWRFTNRSLLFTARKTFRAIRAYRLTMLIIWLLNAAMAFAVWHFGVQHITGRTLWDYLVSFGIYLLNPLAALFVSRFAASPAISGRHAFFKRL